MLASYSRRLVLAAALLPSAGLLGCNNPDNPELAKAPPYTPPAKIEEPDKLPGGRQVPGANKKYQELMEKRAQQQPK